MGLRIACAKGCGHQIEVGDEQIEEATKHGGALVVAHEVCPTDPQAKMRRFKIGYTVEEVIEGEAEPVLLAKMGSDIEAGSFKLALPKMQEDLAEKWNRIVGLQDIVDAEAFSTQDEQAVEGGDDDGSKPGA
jgi:hypothetical protein